MVLASLPTTFRPTVELLHDVASAAHRCVAIREVLCEQAWRHFTEGDQAAYATEIARTIEVEALPDEVIVLAQASMAPAAELVRHLGVPVFSSPKLGVRAALIRYRATA